MPEPKTKVTKASVADFFKAIKDPQVRADCQTIAAMMEQSTQSPPEMWGPAIVGFGRRLQTYASGKQAEWMQIGFSPRKQNIALYLMMGDLKDHEALRANLGPHNCGKGCLYIKRLADIHLPALEKLIQAGVKSSSKAAAAGEKK